MKVIIAGSRSIGDYGVLLKALEKWPHDPYQITEVVSGHAYGVDRLGERWAEAQHIPISLYMADWYLHGKSAGYIRNVEMATHAGGLLAVWDGKSRGTSHMIEAALKGGLKIVLHTHHVRG